MLVLGSQRARTAGLAFASGWIAGLAAVSALVVVLVSGGADADGDDPGVAWLQLGIGLLFVVLAAKQWRQRPGPGEAPEMPRWMAGVAGAVLAYLLLGARAARPLAAVRRFMSDNNAVIMMVVLLLLGATFVGDAVGGL